MEHGLELIIPILEILEIEVCNIIYKPRDIGNLSFSTSSYPGNPPTSLSVERVGTLQIIQSNFQSTFNNQQSTNPQPPGLQVSRLLACRPQASEH